MLNQFSDNETAAPATWRVRRRRMALVTAAMAAASGVAAAGVVWGLARVLPGSSIWVLATAACAGLGLLAGHQRLRLRGRQAAIAGAAVVGLLAMSGALFVTTPSGFTEQLLQDPNNQVVATAKQIKEELREARLVVDNGGEAALPTPQTFIAFLKTLPTDPIVLNNPWGGPPQQNGVVLKPGGPLPTVTELIQGAAAVDIGTKLGPGRMPDGGPYTALTYGAIIYDANAAHGQYVVYGVGKEGDQAVLVYAARGLH